MIVSEGTVFLLLLLFGIYKIKQSMDKESALSNQQKNFFLSVTHELKTPIAATKLQLQTLQKQNLDEPTRRHLIGNALQETERLNNLIDNILFASRLESNEFIFKKETTDLSTLINDITERYYKPELVAGTIQLQLEKTVLARVDSQAFPSVITNLVDNALKYSGTEKKVTLSLERVKDRVILSIADKGVGIKDQEKSKVFEKFYRAGNEETRRTKGTGLGLYIVNYIAKKHDAVIRIKDNVPNGSVFELILNAS